MATDVESVCMYVYTYIHQGNYITSKKKDPYFELMI